MENPNPCRGVDHSDGLSVLNETYVIREIYESENSIESFLIQLERALHKKYKYIVIEPKRLAEETGRWIMLGNILVRLSLASGVSSIAISLASNRLYISVPLTGLALITQGFYYISWYFDPCSKYQIANASSMDSQLDERSMKAATRILVYKDNMILNGVQRSVTLAALILCGYQLYRRFR